ncbi:putative transcriptional regulator, AsnC family [Ammonifex degensii KC4]|uniref:siroheme decarboxylase n=1 Tax=Ammonifex degensii (strain DSM 10501 / KC4) TaxID=429009 RepID=C9R7T6_AMMDK|nr:AsnC family transcriptional regulator [Ammonifex degensii]ACX52365.1 putative transcriptional regulator, AsnC family [Ammonifex degensii KC4]
MPGKKAVLTDTDRRLLAALQKGFSPVPEPFRELAAQVGMTEEALIARLRELKEMGVIRRLGAIIDSRKIGYTGTLCALAVPPERIPEVAEVINSYPEVTHNYVREHETYNVWFTILAPSHERINQILQEIKEKTGITQFLNLPARRIFKIRVNFDLEGSHDRAGTAPDPGAGE